MKSCLVVGAGFAGAVLARELAEKLGVRCRVIDSRDHIGGNCYTARDAETDVMVHRYGPHIFNTSHEDVWSYVQRFGRFIPHVNRVKAVTEKGVFSFPINLHTINQLFGKAMGPEEARAYIASLGDTTIGDPASFKEQALKLVGREIYETFFEGYTIKQWGCDPSELPASILKRLPVRFNYNDNYYASKYQAMPMEGYTPVIAAILDHPLITVALSTSFVRGMTVDYDHVIYTGPIDEFFGHVHGRLGYRTVWFEEQRGVGDMQGNAVLNYTSKKVPQTRVHEHKHFAPWETHEKSILFTEYSKETEPTDVPYYPKRMSVDMERFALYQSEAAKLTGYTFAGRLACYRYLDMDQVIGESLDAAAIIIQSDGGDMPLFAPARMK